MCQKEKRKGIEIQEDRLKKERKIQKRDNIEEKRQDRSIDRKRDGKREGINDLNNNAALCIHCHTLALGHHQDRLSDTQTTHLVHAPS